MPNTIDEVLSEKTLEDLESISPPLILPTLEPELTRDRVERSIDLLRRNEADRQVARKCNLSKNQVREIRVKMTQKYQELYNAANPQPEPEPAPELIDKDSWVQRTARACYNDWRTIEIIGGSESDLFRKFSYSFVVIDSFFCELNRIKNELRSKPSAEVISNYLDVSRIQDDYGIPEFVIEPVVIIKK